MRIAILGTGSVGRALAGGWSEEHEVVFGSRRPDDAEVVGLAGSLGATVAGHGEAVEGADVVVLATPWDGTEELVRGLGELGGAVLVDCTNPLAPGLSGLTVGQDDSGGERVARAASGARVVKAFNTTGAGNMADADYPGGRLAMPLCGDEAGAKEVVAALAETLGFEPLDCGPLASARYLEPLAMVWITLAHRMGHGRDMGFALLRR
jgi:predicted dinucleotide-binding enzyme